MTGSIDLDPPLRIGTRGSSVAVQCATHVAQTLREHGLTRGFRIKKIGGNRNGGDPSGFAGGALLTQALRDAVANRDVDIAVHFAKDIPPGSHIRMGAVLARRDPREALCSQGHIRLAELPRGAQIGVSSLIRANQIRRLRPDLTLVPVRGPVEARLDRVHDKDLDATILAHCIVDMRGFLDAETQLFDVDQMIPTPAQGIIVVEVARGVDSEIVRLLSQISDKDTWMALAAERRFQTVMASVTTGRVGAISEMAGDNIMLLRAIVCGDDGQLISGRLAASIDPGDPLSPVRLGDALARQMEDKARDVRCVVSVPHDKPRVLFGTTSSVIDRGMEQAIIANGGQPVPVPLTTTRVASDEDLDAVLEAMKTADQVGISSSSVVQVLADHARHRGTTLDEILSTVKVAAIGSRASIALADEYVEFELVPSFVESVDAISSVWPRVRDGERKPVTVLPSSSNTSPVIERVLTSLGWDVRVPIVYIREPATCGPAQQEALAYGWPEVVIVGSRTAVEGLEALYGLPPASVHVVAIGHLAAIDAGELGLRVDAVSPSTQPAEVIRFAMSGLSRTSQAASSTV